MEIKIIGRNVVPDRIVLYENDACGKSLVFTAKKINDGVNLENLNGYLEVEKDLGGSDRFLLDKVVDDEYVYFSLAIDLNLTNTADILNSQIIFEDVSGTVSYRTKVFYIDVKYSVDGESSFEQVVPSILFQIENRVEKALEDCIKVKDELFGIDGLPVAKITVDSNLSTTSENPVKNKAVTVVLNNKLEKIENTTTYNLVYASKPQQNGQPSEQISIKTYYDAMAGQIPMYSENGGLGGYKADGSEDITVTGGLITGIPKDANQATPKKWVEDNFSKSKFYKHTVKFKASHTETSFDGSGVSTVYEDIEVIYYSTNTLATFNHNNGDYAYVKASDIIATPIIINKTMRAVSELNLTYMIDNDGLLSLVYRTLMSNFLGLSGNAAFTINILDIVTYVEEV